MADWYKDDLILRIGIGVLIADTVIGFVNVLIRIVDNLPMILALCFIQFWLNVKSL